MSEHDDASPTKVAYRDSRRAAYRILRAERHAALRRVLLFVLVALAVVLAWNWLAPGFPPAQRAVLLLFLLAVGLWSTEAIPAFAVGLMILGSLVFVLGTPVLVADPTDPSAYLNTWASPVIWLILGGFFLADGLARTGLDRRLFALAIRPAGDRPARVLLAVMLTSAVASMFISNTSTTALMVGALLPFVRQTGRDSAFGRGLLVAIPLAASIGGMGTIIGSPPNAIAAGAAAEAGRPIDFVEWMAVGLPIGLALVLVAWRFVLWRFPPGELRIDTELQGEEPPLDGPGPRRIVASLAAATVALWLTTPVHGIPVAVISLVPIVGLTMTQVLGASEVRGLPWDTLMLVAGGLALGAAVVDTGLAGRLAAAFQALTGARGDIVVFLLLAYATCLLSNFMSNTATVSLILPVAVALVPGREIAMCLILGLSASCALLLPVSTPPNAVAYSTGLLRTRDLRPSGLLVGLCGPPAVVAWVLFVVRYLPA